MSRTGLWDTHAHLDDPAFAKDRKELLAQLEQDLDGIINAGCDAPSSAMAVELAEQYDFIFAAVGYHPENLKGIAPNYLEQLAAWAVHPKVVAIGEIGLDYYWKENEPKEVQKRIFLEQIDLAKQFDLPIIIHDRAGEARDGGSAGAGAQCPCSSVRGNAAGVRRFALPGPGDSQELPVAVAGRVVRSPFSVASGGAREYAGGDYAEGNRRDAPVHRPEFEGGEGVGSGAGSD